MTRMWGVEPENMCRQHLMGEHNEMHMIVGSIRKHPHGEAIVRGHAKKGQINTTLIQERHDALADEMVERGYEHESPMNYEDKLNIGRVDASLDPSVGPDNIRDELADRCPDCRERMSGVKDHA